MQWCLKDNVGLVTLLRTSMRDREGKGTKISTYYKGNQGEDLVQPCDNQHTHRQH